jgi:hypothetical protein
MALAHSTIGSKMGAIDGARTARTCAALEQAWSDYSHVIPSRSPADYATDMETMKAQAGAPVRVVIDRVKISPPPVRISEGTPTPPDAKLGSRKLISPKE